MKREVKLSNKKLAWVGKRTVNLKGHSLLSNASSEIKSTNALLRLIASMNKDVTKAVKTAFDSPTAHENYAMDASLPSILRILINKKIEEWERRFNDFSKVWASKVVTAAEAQASNTLESSLDKLSGGLTIKTSSISSKTKDIMTASVNEASSLIKTISSSYLSDVKEGVMRSLTDPKSDGIGGLQETISNLLSNTHKKIKNKAKNIALDQTRKAYNNIAASKMISSGVESFEWGHSGGSKKPRQDHINMNGNVYRFDNLPVIDKKTGEKGIPGQAINCRCFMTPVIQIESGKVE